MGSFGGVGSMTDYKIADINQSTWGEKEVRLAESELSLIHI